MFWLQLYLWIAPHLLVAVCLAGFLHRGYRREYPAFLTYLLFQVAQFAIFFVVYLLMRRSLVPITTYRWLLVSELSASAVLQIMVYYEIANKLIFCHSTLGPVLRPLLRWGTALCLLVSAAVSAAFSQNGIHRVMSVFQVLNFSSSLINLGLLFILALFARAFRISWRSLPAGILLGFAIDSSAEMGATSLVSALGARGYFSVDMIRLVSFHVCVLIWLFYIFRPDRSPEYTGKGLQKSDLEFWDQELQRMVQR